MESNLNSPIIETEDSEAAVEAAIEATSPRPWRLLNLLLRFRAFEALRYHEYLLLWKGQSFSSMGQWMDEVTRGWLIYELTNSSVQLGLVRGIQVIPYLLLSPVAGSAADRYSRKTQVVVAQAVNGVIYALTALLILTGRIKPWHVYVTAFLMAIVQTFQQPARAAMISDTVPPACLTNAIGLNAMLNNTARSAGPALAGILIAAIGTGGTYSVQAVFYFMATFWTIKLRRERPFSMKTGGHSVHGDSFGRSIIEGWMFSWRCEEVRTGIFTVMFVSLFIVPFTTLLPVFARDLLGVGSTGQGLLLTAMGVGAFCSAVLVALAGNELPRGKLMLGSVMVYGFILVIFAVSPWFQLSLAVMVLVGLCHVHSHALVQTVIQAYSPANFRGRTMALFHMNRVIMMAGSMLIGTLASLLGARWAVASMASVGALTMIVIYLAMPRARLIR